MRLPRLLLKALEDLRWQVFWYGFGLALMAALVVYIFPSYTSQLGDFQIPEAMRALIGDVDYTTGVGFISAEFLSWVPVVLAVFAIMSGTGAIGGEEAGGTLDLLLAQPVSRRRLILEKLAGIYLASLGLAAIVYVGWLISVPFVNIDVGLEHLAVATLNLVPLVLTLQSLAVLASVTLSTRGAATGAVTAFAVASYFVNYLAALVDAIQPVRVISIFYHYHGTDVLTGGVNWGGLAVLLAVTVAATSLSVVAFERREIGIGQEGFKLPWLHHAAAAESS
jgi:ABC-2 type transport system permease protein